MAEKKTTAKNTKTTTSTTKKAASKTTAKKKTTATKASSNKVAAAKKVTSSKTDAGNKTKAAKSSKKPYGRVAVITRTKNRPILLVRAIESVVNQEYSDWLMVIVNDGGDPKPVDALVEKFKEKLDGKIHVVHNPESLGMEAASNKGINSCDSEYVIIHDDDDAWHPTFLNRTVDFIENNSNYSNLGGVVTYMELVYEEIVGDNVNEIRREGCRNWIPELTLWQMAAGNLFAPISFLYKRSVYKEIGGSYREDLPVLGDWEFNLRFMKHYDIGLIPEELSYYYHRIAGTNNQYSNTVVDGVDKHSLYNQILRNELLREDIQNNQIGLGYLINQAHVMNVQHKQVQRLYHLLEQVYGRMIKYLTPIAKISRKAKFWKNK